MTFAVVGILGHFSKTVLLFFLPQLINVIYSVPQLLRVIPCPRHRLPKYNAETNTVQASRTIIAKKDVNFLTRSLMQVGSSLYLVDKIEDNESININNLTLINFFLIHLGPMSEPVLTKRLLVFQIFCSCIAFIIRYPLASYFYDT